LAGWAASGWGIGGGTCAMKACLPAMLRAVVCRLSSGALSSKWLQRAAASRGLDLRTEQHAKAWASGRAIRATATALADDAAGTC
jgi:hypothetical protein